MAILNFSAFAQAVQSGTANMEPTNVVRLILNSVTSCNNATNPAKGAYFESRECLEYFRAESNVSPKIAEATKNSGVCRFALEYFSNVKKSRGLLLVHLSKWKPENITSENPLSW